jgi:hypothetical protein
VFDRNAILLYHRDALVENWLNHCFEAKEPMLRKNDGTTFFTAEQVLEEYQNRSERVVTFIEELLKNL